MKLSSAIRTILIVCVFLIVNIGHSQKKAPGFRSDLKLDEIRLSDPCILPDAKSEMYYMTGSGGLLWKSKDLVTWKGPYIVTKTDPDSWMGEKPMIWAAELHKYHDKYYYFATFTNRDVKIDTVKGNVIERRASHVLVSDKPDGPYVPMADPTYLPADKPTLDGTLWVDTDGKPYMVYCYEWLQNWDGTIEKIELKSDLSGSVGEGELLFKASESPWSREKDENGDIIPNKVTDGPWLFRTQTGRLGMLWTSWIFSDYVQGVAYSESGTLDGPWIQDSEPITPPNFGHSMLFKTFDGILLMSLHSHKVGAQGEYIRIPRLFRVDDSGDKLKLGEEYIPGE
ncbi:glycoside hydrolase family 43 protein [Robertkochia solimangrovi]|uniref:glycoside hydrolase family 43 protein n=1 Tax=Robertkochia solimangrovi TaxID=2213046 RepID=UPI001180EBD3|nr:glycoside hydrolase family 43 protein [Robertkochia solimangrovi]TRZ41997.1 glycoside hydrolase [Robertkochia solimangrovi]